MKVDAKNLVSFLTRTTVDGLIVDALLVFGPDGLRIVALDESHTGGVNGLLHKEGNFQDYAEMQVPIKDTARLIKLLRMIEGDAELVVEGNTFKIIGDNFEGAINLAKKEDLKCKFSAEEWPKFGYHGSFEVDGSILENAKKVANNLGTEKMTVAAVKDGLFTIQIGEGTTDKGIAKAKVEYENVSAVYSETLLDFAKVVKGTVRIAFKDDYPMTITSEDENSIIQWMVAPVLPEKKDKR
jgi:hypothetical protein